MKRIILFSVFLLASVVSFAQIDSDTSTVYRYGLPISEDDTVTNFPGFDFKPFNEYKKVSFDALPKELREELNENSRFSGWRDSLLYFDDVNNRYFVTIPVDSTVQIFGFNKRGNVITFDEQPLSDQ